VAPVVSNPTAGCASPLNRLGFGVLVGCKAQSTSLSVPPALTSFYMAQGDGAHQSSGLGAPDQGVFVRARPDSDPLKSGSTGDQTNNKYLFFYNLLIKLEVAHGCLAWTFPITGLNIRGNNTFN
jgi:hypothetical protein